MLRVYAKNETTFTSNGLVVLDQCLMAPVAEELNGAYELELEYPLDDRGKWQYLVEENIIKITDGQLFRIYKKTKVIQGIRINARHIFFDLLDNFLADVRPTNLAGAGALDWILTRTQYAHSFTSTSDVATVATKYFVKKNVVDAILGSDGIVETWGGELERNNFIINLHATRGADRGVLISYGKNIVGIEETLDIDSIATRIMPVGKDGLLLTTQVGSAPVGYVDSQYIGNYSHPKIFTVEFNDIDNETDLAIAAQNYFLNSQCDVPQFNYEIDFIELSKTEEYKNYAVLESVYMADTVTIKHSKLGLNLKAKVIKIEKDAVSNKITKIELGYFKKNLANTITNSIQEVKASVVQAKTDMQAAIQNATDLITGTKGGNVVIVQDGNDHPTAILIMDTTDQMTAQHVWKWSIGGFGFSSTGINGPYTTAITQDGSIVADFMTTGNLTASLIKTGILKSFNNKTWTNMEDGTFNFGDGRLTFDGTTFAINFAGTNLQTALDAKASTASVNSLIAGLQTQIDGSITTWFYAYAPTTANVPASGWTTTDMKNQHLGDLFYDTATGYCYRYQVLNSIYSWQIITDTDVTKALQDASNAQDTADSKRRIFVATPTTPYEIGDMWAQGSAGELMRCKVTRLTGAYVAADWELASKYTDDTAVNNLIIGGRNILLGTNNGVTGWTYSKQNGTTLIEAMTYLGVSAVKFITSLASTGWQYISFPLSKTLLKNNTTYMISFDILSTVDNSLNVSFMDTNALNSLGATPSKSIVANVPFKFTGLLTTNAVTIANQVVYIGGLQEVGTYIIANLKVEEGSKATTWTPAPEDITTEIDEVRTTAEALQDFTDTTFADGIISRAEAQAIAEHLNTLTKENGDLVNQYTIVYANVNLSGTPKTNLASAKTAYDTAYSNLVSSVNTAIADNKTTTAEKADVDTKFTAYGTALKTLTQRINEAMTAISTKLASDAQTAATAVANAAQADADAAQGTADIAKAYTDNLASDIKVTPDEKLSLKQAWDLVVAEATVTTGKIPAQAIVFGVNHDTFDTAYAALNTYLNTTLTVFASMTTATTIVRATWDGKWKDYYNARTDLLNAIAAKARTLANTAQTAANDAQADADAANTLLADIASDSKLTPVEKSAVRKEWTDIISEYAINNTEAGKFSISMTAYTTAINALGTYLHNGTAWTIATPATIPTWIADANLGSVTTIVGATFRSKFKDYYDARANLLYAISSSAALVKAGFNAIDANVQNNAGKFLIKNGAIDIQDGTGNSVFYVDENGQASSDKSFIAYDQSATGGGVQLLPHILYHIPPISPDQWKEFFFESDGAFLFKTATDGGQGGKWQDIFANALKLYSNSADGSAKVYCDDKLVADNQGADIIASGWVTEGNSVKGYLQFRSGHILNFGRVSVSASSGSVTMMKTFPSQCVGVVIGVDKDNSGSTQATSARIVTRSTSAFTWDSWIGGAQTVTPYIHYVAFGV